MTQSSKDMLLESIRTIRQLTKKLDWYESRQCGDIAIIGMACRFPGADSIDDYWRLLCDGRVAVGEVKPDRWDNADFFSADKDAAGKVITPYAGMIDDVYAFDPEFFGLSGVEAEHLDPQQRLLLENSWLALEDAGFDRATLRGSATGVFVGIGSNDYGNALLSDAAAINAYVASGNSLSMAAGRLSYFYDFTGPSLSIDTACSSSLVAVHEACQKLRLGDCDMALAAGVNCLLTPHVSINFSQANMLTDARECHVFDARAKGYVRGEGCAVLVLKRLPDALHAGDRIHAVIKGSGVNHDGRSSGLTVPNGSAQEAVIRLALRQAGVAPRDVAYVEAHGTGTSLGDPIEANALARVYAADADRAPLFVGAVKANLGHLEGAAGIAGLIKAALVVRHGVVPSQPGFERLNPKIDWDPRRVVVATTRSVLARDPDDTLLAAVSSFGFSGTNAHIILASAPSQQQEFPLSAAGDAEAQAMVVSARSTTMLRQAAAEAAAYLRSLPAGALAQVSQTSTMRRASATQRIAVVGATVAELIDRLDDASRSYTDDAAPCRRVVLLMSADDDPAVLRQALDSFRWGARGDRTAEQATEGGIDETLPTIDAAHRALLDALAAFGVLVDEVIVRGIDSDWIMRASAGDPTMRHVPYRAAETVAGRGWMRITLETGRVDALTDDADLVRALEARTVVTTTTATPAHAPGISSRVHRLDSRASVLEMMADLYSQGVHVHWQCAYSRTYPPAPGFPQTRFERKVLRSPRVADYLARAGCGASKDHPLLLGPQALPGGLSFRFDMASPWLALLDQHRVRGRRIVPASLLIELMRHAAAHVVGDAMRLSSVAFLQPVDLDQDDRDYVLRCLATPSPVSVTVWSRPRNARPDVAWTRHASAEADVGSGLADADSVDAPWQGETVDVAGLYTQHGASQVTLGDAFRAVRSMQVAQARARAEIVLPAHLGRDALTCATVVLDGCFQATAGVRADTADTFLLASIGEAVIAGAIPASVQVDIRQIAQSPADTERMQVDIALRTHDGMLLGHFRDVVFRRIESAPQTEHAYASLCYAQRWTALASRAVSAETASADVMTMTRRLTDTLDRVDALESLTQLAERHGLHDYNRYRASLEHACLALAASALSRLGWHPVPGETFSLDDLLQRLGVVPAQHRLVGRFIAALRDAGYLHGDGGMDPWVVHRPLPVRPDLDALQEDFPTFVDETRFIQRCDAALADVLAGRRDPLQVLFGSETLQGSEAIYVTSPISRVLNTHLARLVADLGRSGRHVRILEIGAGTGGTSHGVLGALAPEHVDTYCYTDLSPLFLDRAKARFGEYGFIDYRIFNVEEPIAHQGFEPGDYDIVIAANVLHATRSIRETLAHVSQLLAPGGCLLLRECIAPQLSADISFGMTSGWWRFEDTALRRDYPVLSTAQWCEQLAAFGFAPARALVADADSAEALIVAQAPWSARRQRWLVAHDGQDDALGLIDCLQAGGEDCRQMRWNGSGPDDRSPAEVPADEAFDHIVYFPPAATASEDVVAHAHALSAHFIAFCRDALGPGTAPEGRIWCITRQAEHVIDADRLDGLAQSVLTGVVKCAALEHPARIGGVIDLQGQGDESQVLARHIRAPGRHAYVALRDGRLYAPQLWPSDVDRLPSAADGGLAHAGTVLVTGGMGGIGHAIASALSRRPGVRLVLVGRDMNAPDRQAGLERLREHGATVHGHALDVGDAAQVDALFAHLRDQGIQIDAIVHAAGVGGDQPLLEIAPDDGRDIVAAKLDGTWNLHRASDPRHVRTFIVLSTMLSLWGARHKTHYVLANHLADRVMAYRRSRGLPGFSLQLGPVDCGMLGDAGKRAAESVGVQAFDVRRIVDYLLECRIPDVAGQALVDVDWARFKPIYQNTWLGAYFDPVGDRAPRRSGNGARTADDDAQAQDFARRFADLPDIERERLLESLLIDLLRELLGLSGPASKYRTAGFHDLGMDSLLTLAFAGRLSRRCGIPVSSVDIFDSANLANLQTWLGQRLRDALPVASATSTSTSTSIAAPVAIAPQAEAADAADANDHPDALERELLALEALLRT